MRWVWVLACSHNLLSDEPAQHGFPAFCPGCGFSVSVVDSYTWKETE